MTTEGKPMDSRTGMEKVCEVKFTTATSGGREHATGLRAAATFSASLAPPRQARPLSPRPRRPAARVAAPGDARERGLAQQGPARETARAPARGGRACACARDGVRVRRPHKRLGRAFVQYALGSLVCYAFSLSHNC